MNATPKDVWISWNGWLENAIQSYPYESCGLLFTSKPYESLPFENWHIIPIGNISEKPKTEWKPDPIDMKQAKYLAKKNEWTRLGNVHTHPYPFLPMPHLSEPSEKDLYYAKRYNDVVRGIISIYPGENGIQFCDYCFHDQHGHLLDIDVKNWDGHNIPTNIQLITYPMRKERLLVAEKELLGIKTAKVMK